MLAIEVELLTGRYAATAHDDRRRGEWPPHPARFFSALVAALHDREPVDSIERNALLWLERQPPPGLDVDLRVDERVGRRDVHDVFVPVNDVSVVGDVWPLVRALEEAKGAVAAAELNQDKTPKSRRLDAAVAAQSSADRKLSVFITKALASPASATAVDLKVATALMPDRRTRQARTFPVVVPGRLSFRFLWETSPATDIRAGLDRLCGRVTRLGHSSSLVRCTLMDQAVAPTLIPTSGGRWVLRVTGEGQLDRLEAEFARHQAVESRVLPARPQRYDIPPPTEPTETPGSVFTEDWILFERREGARLLSSRGPDLARALRAAILEANGENAALPPVLSGHAVDGRASDRPHVAFVPCPFVGYRHADGSVQGCAIVFPRDIEHDHQRALLRLIAIWERRTARDGLVELAGEGLPRIRLARVAISDKQSLSATRWCRASTRFITATPIALDRHPGNLRSNAAQAAERASIEAQRSIADACERIRLPRPISVEISLAPMVAGAQPVRDFRPWPHRPDRPARARVHADIRFGQPVRGPVLLGAGRYFGLGLCLPVSAGDQA